MSSKCSGSKAEDQPVLRAHGPHLSNCQSLMCHMYNGTVPTKGEQGAIIYNFQGIASYFFLVEEKGVSLATPREKE